MVAQAQSPRTAGEMSLCEGLIRLAYSKPGLRPFVLLLVKRHLTAGRAWGGDPPGGTGQSYGPNYTTVDPKKPPTNRGHGKCFYQTGDEKDRCYVKRDIPSSGNQEEYNKKYKRKVYGPNRGLPKRR